MLYPPRRDAAPERVDVLVYGIPDSSPYAIFASVNPILTLISSGLGYLGGMIEAVGKPGCTVIMAAPSRDTWDRVAHASYPEVWERFLAETRDPYEITERHAEDYARRPDYVEAYRHRYAFHPIHGILATHPLKRLRHVGRVIVAAPASIRTCRVTSASMWRTASRTPSRWRGGSTAPAPPSPASSID